MLGLGILIYSIQVTSFAYFFTFFFHNEHKIRNFILMMLIFVLIMGPVSQLINNSYITIPTGMIMVYVMLRILFHNESKMRCLWATIIWEFIMFFCEIIMLAMLLLSDTEIQQVTFFHQYTLWFYVVQYICLLIFYSLAIVLFGPKEASDPQTIILESILMALQILSFLLCTCIVYEINLYLIVLYSVLFLLSVLYLFKKLIQFQEQKKQKVTAHFLQEQLNQQIEHYIQLKQQDQFRKLRHDYINFMKSTPKQP